MRATSIAVLLASFQTLVIARPAVQGAVSENQHEVVKKDLPGGPTWPEPLYCTQASQGGGFGAVYTALQSSAVSYGGYSSFCSQVVQSTFVAATYTTASGVLTDTQTATTTTAVSSTKTDKSSATTTALCPKAAVPTQQCNVKANGYSQYVISEQYIGAKECNQLCLSTPSCKSFQNVPNQAPMGLGLEEVNLCNLYNDEVKVVADTWDGSVARIFDRGCRDLLPAGCSASSPSPASSAKSQITPAPSLANAVALEKRDYTIPPFLSSLVVGEEILYLIAACSCLITQGPPLVTVTVTNLVQSWDYKTVTTTQTLLYPFTTYPNLHTKYKTVS